MMRRDMRDAYDALLKILPAVSSGAEQTPAGQRMMGLRVIAMQEAHYHAHRRCHYHASANTHAAISA